MSHTLEFCERVKSNFREEQFGFMPIRFIMEAIYSFTRLIENIEKRDLYMIFIIDLVNA